MNLIFQVEEEAGLKQLKVAEGGRQRPGRGRSRSGAGQAAEKPQPQGPRSDCGGHQRPNGGDWASPGHSAGVLMQERVSLRQEGSNGLCAAREVGTAADMAGSRVWGRDPGVPDGLMTIRDFL